MEGISGGGGGLGLAGERRGDRFGGGTGGAEEFDDRCISVAEGEVEWGIAGVEFGGIGAFLEQSVDEFRRGLFGGGGGVQRRFDGGPEFEEFGVERKIGGKSGGVERAVEIGFIAGGK